MDSTIPNDQDDWINAECDCPTYFKMLICKHIVRLAIRLKLTTPSPEAKAIPVGVKRHRGRPAKSKRALLDQLIISPSSDVLCA
ncbi:hypothetical protein NQ314_006468 [Rhamnusium bicolor]|uniref:SWIM-type domain-containing protein n=1 Tax=Rhamnusium bicolor TaxID=1586634 RepID=A0AAV8Z169_9CUCU|nr:hypothetical protein NQ314_006468 [Rhamnusium bicolor]